MGNNTLRKLKKEELNELVKKTHFDVNEIQKIYDQFRLIAGSGEDDGVIDKQEFTQVLGLKGSFFVDRVFALFDEDHNGTIDFKEFLCGLSVFSEKATVEEKLKFSYRIYDNDGDGHISKSELKDLLKASLAENSIVVPDEQLNALIDATYKEAGCTEGKINFKQYSSLVDTHPSMIESMTIHKQI